MGRRRDDEGKLKQEHLEALFSASELFKLRKVNLATRIKKKIAPLYELRKWVGEFEWIVLFEVEFEYRREREMCWKTIVAGSEGDEWDEMCTGRK